MGNKETQDMTGTGDHITLPDEPIQLELFPELNNDPEPKRYYDWMLWALRRKRKNRDKNVTH
jgi:hypothetical protein